MEAKVNLINLPELLTPREVMAYFKISKTTLYRWIREGKLSVKRINTRGDRRFVKKDIQKYIEGLEL